MERTKEPVSLDDKLFDDNGNKLVEEMEKKHKQQMEKEFASSGMMQNAKQKEKSASIYKPNTLPYILKTDIIQKKLNDRLGSKTPAFISSLITITSNNKSLASCEPYSVLAAALQADVLGFSVNSVLGHAYIVPYKHNGITYGQFQLGYKGYLQLAYNTNKILSIAAVGIKKDRLLKYAPLDNIVEIDTDNDFREAGDKSDLWVAKLILNNKREPDLCTRLCKVWHREEIREHAIKHSKSFKNQNSAWHTHFDAMAKKTVLKNLLAKSPLSLDCKIQDFLDKDDAVLQDFDDKSPYYIDNPKSEENF